MNSTSTSAGQSAVPANSQPDQVDVRGPRFGAWVSTAVLVAALLSSGFNTTVAIAILAVQTVVFAIGATLGPRRHPYGRLFATFVAPRLGPVTEREPVPPLKFAQFVGFLFSLTATLGFVFGVPLLGVIATGFALFAAFLNAAFGICLGCQLYPLVRLVQAQLRRARFRAAAPATTP